jgi:hypothetical protein
MENYKASIWDFGNDILYKLCKENPYHTSGDVIITKTLFIGRIYSAALERRRIEGTKIQNNDFYTKEVVKAFKNSNIDNNLKLLKEKSLTESNLLAILKTHKDLMDIIKPITQLDKRSFSSKYLHFHLPNLFFIYDSRANISMKEKSQKKQIDKYKDLLSHNCIDKEYAKFFCKCLELKEIYENETSETITPRTLDNILLYS